MHERIEVCLECKPPALERKDNNGVRVHVEAHVKQRRAFSGSHSGCLAVNSLDFGDFSGAEKIRVLGASLAVTY